jgi:hypothetical protein
LRRKSFDTVEDTYSHLLGRFGIILGDKVANVSQMAHGAARPDHFHRGGLPSPGLPHERSHPDTFS